MQDDQVGVKIDWNGSSAVLQLLTRSGWLRAIRWVDETDSTNRLAKELADQTTHAMPMLIVAKKQTAGRGRLGRSWFSDSGTLTFSLVLGQQDLVDQRDRWPQVALVVGLAVCDVLSEIVESVAVRLKWPNDVYVGGGKVAGVLIETAGRSSDRVVIGVGLNVSTDLKQAPTDVRGRAISVCDFVEHPLDRFLILPEIIDRIAMRIDQWRLDPLETASAFSQVCLLNGCRVKIESGGQQAEGICMGIDQEGQLQVRCNNAEVIIMRSGEVISWHRQSD